MSTVKKNSSELFRSRPTNSPPKNSEINKLSVDLKKNCCYKNTTVIKICVFKPKTQTKVSNKSTTMQKIELIA